MKCIYIFMICWYLLPFSSNAQSGSLFPLPDSIIRKEGRFRITDTFSAAYDAPQLEQPVNRFFQALNARTRTFFRNEFFRPGKQGQLKITAVALAEAVPGVDESYRINVSEAGIQVNANTTVGILRALETLLQLVEKDGAGAYIPFISIADKPAFAWRGLMVDVARHFIPMDVLKRNVDAMAAVKLNVLHLHLTDDEGFRMESKVHPKLHQMGSHGNYYTQEELRQLVAYARDRGIAVIPEFDLPGHSRSWFAGYPELSSTPGVYTPGPRFNVDGKSMGEIMAMMNTAPTATIDPTREQVYQFLDKLMAEVKTIFPYAYFHLGADENNGVAWKQNKSIVAFMEKNKIADAKALEHYFVLRVHKLTQKHNMRMIVWEEAFNKDLPADIIVQKWKPEIAMMGPVLNANTVLAQGNDLLVSSGFYLDHHMPAHIYHQNPSITALKTAAGLKGKLLGGEAAQWSEINDGNTIDTRMWMNTAAIAERLWTNPKQTDPVDMYDRLFNLSRMLDARGLRHIDQYEKGLRSLTGYSDLGSLRLLTDVLTPVKGYKRLFAMISKPASTKHSTAPLNGLADILPLNSEPRWAFRKEVEKYLAEPGGKNEAILRFRLETWTALKEYPLTGEIAAVRPHAENLAALSAVALEAMDKRKNGTLTDDWVKSKQELFKKAGAPVAEINLDVVAELEGIITGKLAPITTAYPLF